MSRQAGFCDTDDRLRWLSAARDLLERLRAVVDFEAFRAGGGGGGAARQP